MTKVEQFEAIRRSLFVHELSIREAADEHGVHRRKVREAAKSAIPAPRKATLRDPPVLTLSLREIVDGWLRDDVKAPRKQRHTGRQIFRRLRIEQAFDGAESTVRRYVGLRRRELGVGVKATVPQTHLPAAEGEVDFYEAWVDFPQGRTKVYLLEVRACYSGREYHVASLHQSQQAFLEGMAKAFKYFGGVFATLRFDNLSSAVKKVLHGRQRVETDRFVAFRSHYLFQAAFCRPGKEGAHEKGGVEGGVGRFRRHHLVPVPVMPGMRELNRYLLTKCQEDDDRIIEGHQHRICDDWQREVKALGPLPPEPFDTSLVMTPRVDSKSRIKVGSNHYSVPVRLVGRRVEARLSSAELTVSFEGKVVAQHERLQGRHQERLDLDHYLELLREKPGAMPGSTALQQCREAELWPATYDRLWSELVQRYGQGNGTRQLIDVLMLHREAQRSAVHLAVELALSCGCISADAVTLMLRHSTAAEVVPKPLSNIGALAKFGRPATTNISGYQQLLDVRRAGARVPAATVGG